MIIEMKGICKSFGPVQVLKSIDFTVGNNEIHALIGENGAGKSTLVKILTGIFTPNSGDIYINGEPQNFKSVRDSERKKIAIINQELNVFGDMTVLENLFLCREIKTKWGRIDTKKQKEIAYGVLRKLGIELDLNRKLGEFSVGIQQLIEIAKSLIIDAELIVMDEPTSALTDKEIVRFFKVITVLKKEKKSIIYISHRLKEIFEICDSITILRDGNFILREQVKNLTYDDIVKNMVGYELGNLFPEKKKIQLGQVLLQASGISHKKNYEDISFSLREGEIIGFAGLMGSGRTEIMNSLYGVNPIDKGSFFVKGDKVVINSVHRARKYGIGYVTENRKDEGLFLDFTISDNILNNNLSAYSKYNVINYGLLQSESDKYLKMVNIKFRDRNQLAFELSGGNQQKVVLAKWLANKPQILILDEPTRGIDVNSKKQIYELIFKLRELKIGFIIVSSELIELLGIVDKIYVIHEGTMTAVLDNENLTDEIVMKYMMGGAKLE